MVIIASPGASAAPGGYTQADVDRAIERGVDWLSTQQHPTGGTDTHAAGSWDSDAGFAEAESGLAVVSYGVLANGDLTFSTVPNSTAADRARWHGDMVAGVDYLLKQQNANGGWDSAGGFSLATYSTGIALLALSYAGDLQSATRNVSGAIAKGRHYLLMTQSASPSVTGNHGQEAPGIPGPTVACTSAFADPTARFCGGWDYSPGTANYQRSDESNTGFGVTGLAATGGVPDAAAKANVGWQRNIQMLATNPFTASATRSDGKRPNDGGGSYSPFSTSGSFSSNANDTGSLIFGFAYAKVPASDAGAKAAIAFGQDVLDVYEKVKALTPRAMIYHTGSAREPACKIGDAGCTWQFARGEGGYHYSMFALSKGLGQYLPADLGDPANFYAKVVDLLLSEQLGATAPEPGAWPADLRDDGSQIGSTAFAIMSLGRVGQPAAVNGTVFEDLNANGVRDAGENALGGWTVYVDVNNNGVLDSGEPSTSTATDGTYSMQNLPEGQATVREITQAGFECTAPPGCAKAVDLALGSRHVADFGNRRPPAQPSGGVKGATACGSARHFTIKVRIRRHLRDQVKSVSIVAAGKRVRAHRRNGRWVATVNLRGKVKGTYRVRIRVRLRNGRLVRGTRTYHTCVKGRRHGPPRV